MKLKSLILGSVAAAGLTTGAFAADLGVLTSLDVCDTLGLSGLTISSDTNCLQISGSVDYRLRFGNYRAAGDVATTYDGTNDPFIDDSRTHLGVVPGVGDHVHDLDWDTRVRAYLKAVGTASSDFGPAQAVIGLRQVDEWRAQNEGYGAGAPVPAGFAPTTVAGGDHTGGVQLEEAYVRVGDTTVLLAGMRKHGADGSVANVGDDSPFSFLFISDKIDGGGVLVDGDDRRLGGHSIQIQSDLGNGVSAGLGLENIDTSNGSVDLNSVTVRPGTAWAGTLVGVLQYAGENVSAHVTGLAYGVLDGDVDAYAIHAGATGTFDMFKIRGAVGYDSNFKGLGYSVVHALASGEASFDMFKIALSGEVANFNSQTDYSFGGKITAQVADGVSLNLDASWFRDALNAKTGGATDTVRIQAEIAAAVTETITITAAVGSYFGSGVFNEAVHVDNLYYGRVGVAWVPGGDFKSGLTLEANSEGGYRTEFTASKSFQ